MSNVWHPTKKRVTFRQFIALYAVALVLIMAFWAGMLALAVLIIKAVW